MGIYLGGGICLGSKIYIYMGNTGLAGISSVAAMATVECWCVIDQIPI